MSAARTGKLAGRTIALGVTGSIAAYKAVIVARRLIQEGARVRVLMTHSSKELVGPSTFAGVTGEPVLTELFPTGGAGEPHVALASESDLVVVVPATADFLSRVAAGRADDLLTATLLCARCPVLVVPAMHPTMWSHPATRRNVKTLGEDGRVAFVGPVRGEVASGDTGEGRMAEPEEIVAACVARLSTRDLEGARVVVTAGPTVEDIDPVRFVGNRSSGKMGFAIAEEAARRGACVLLVAGPVTLATPPGVDRRDVRSALEMQAALGEALGPDLKAADALVMAAAVGDYRPERVLTKKLKRGEEAGDLVLRLVQNPDVLAAIGKQRKGARPVLVGFAVETGTDAEIVRFARKKLAAKRVDVVVANHAAESMGREDNRVLLVGARSVETLDVLPKAVVAARIVDLLAKQLDASRGAPRRPAGRPSRKRRT